MLVLAVLLFLLSLGVICLAGARLWEVYTGKRAVLRDDPQDACLKPAPVGGGE